LTREFIETSLVATGVEWFRQRLAAGPEAGVFKNWECAATLNEEAGDLAASWRCRLHSWRVTQHRRNVDPRKKAQLLRALLGWAQRHGFREEGLGCCASWRTPLAGGTRPLDGGVLAGVSEVPSGRGRHRWASEAARRPRAASRPARGRLPEPPKYRRRARADARLGRIKVSLARLEDLPEPALSPAARRRGSSLEASRHGLAHGLPRQRWAVADWDRNFFEGDQKAVRKARFSTDIAGQDKANASDHVLREKIHLVLREHPEIPVYVIGTGDGDFREVVNTLQAQGKQVILWTTRRSVSESYGGSLRGPDRIRIEWLEDLVFGDTAGDAR
jgi:hypothetical protein